MGKRAPRGSGKFGDLGPGHFYRIFSGLIFALLGFVPQVAEESLALRQKKPRGAC